MVQSRSEAGFSAIELVFVALIIGIIATIAIPNAIAARRSYSLQVATSALEQQLNRCRQEAVRANLPMKLKAASHTTRIDLNRDNTFDSNDGDAVTISDDAAITASTPTDGIVTYTSRGEMQVGNRPSYTVTLGATARVITIDPRGAVTVGPEIAAAR